MEMTGQGPTEENKMDEKSKMQKGEPFNVNMDDNLLKERRECRELCFEYNQISAVNGSERRKKIRGILGSVKGDMINVEPPFFCDYGWNVEVGENFYSECNLVIQDAGGVTFGDNVFVGPNCGFYTKARPFDFERRSEGVEFARPIKVGDNVCFGPNVHVMQGVTIGKGAYILGGSVVTDDVPENAIMSGNPAVQIN